MSNLPALLPLLLPCTVCNGDQETEDADGEINHCHVCFNGYQAVALPLADVLNIMHGRHKVNGEAETTQALRELAQAPQPKHPLLYNVVEVPHHFPVYLQPRKPAP